MSDIIFVGTNYKIVNPRTGCQVDPNEFEDYDYEIHYTEEPASMTNGDIQVNGEITEVFKPSSKLFLKTYNTEGFISKLGVVEHEINAGLREDINLQKLLDGNENNNFNDKFKITTENVLMNRAYAGLLNEHHYGMLRTMYDKVYGAFDWMGLNGIYELIMLSHLNGCNVQVINRHKNEGWFIRTTETDMTVSVLCDYNTAAEHTVKYGIMDDTISQIIMAGEPIYGVDGAFVFKSKASSWVSVSKYDYNTNRLIQYSMEAKLIIQPSRQTEDIFEIDRARRMEYKAPIFAPRPQLYGNEFSRFKANEYASRALDIYNRDHPNSAFVMDLPDGLRQSSYKCIVEYPKSLGGNTIRNSHVTNGDELEQSRMYASSPRKLFHKGLSSADNVVCIVRNYIKYDKFERALVNVFVSIDNKGKCKRCYVIVSYIERVSQMLLTSFSYDIIYSIDGTIELKYICGLGPNGLNDDSLIPGMSEMSSDLIPTILTEIKALNRIIDLEVQKVISKLRDNNRKVRVRSSMINIIFSQRHGKNMSEICINQNLLMQWMPAVLRSTGSQFWNITYGVPLSLRDSMSCRIKANSMQLRDEITLSFCELDSKVMSHKFGCTKIMDMYVDKNNREVVMPCGKRESIYNQMLHHHNCIVDMQSFKIKSSDEKCHGGFICGYKGCDKYYPSNILKLACCKVERSKFIPDNIEDIIRPIHMDVGVEYDTNMVNEMIRAAHLGRNIESSWRDFITKRYAKLIGNNKH